MSTIGQPHEFLPNRKGTCKQIVGAVICGLPEDARARVLWASKHPQEELKDMQSNVEPSGLIEIARSYSFKLNMDRIGGPRYESRDFFCSCKEECLKADATATSARLHAFCQTEVARAVNEYMKTRKKPAPAPAPKQGHHQDSKWVGPAPQQTSFDSPFPDDDDVPF